MERADFERAPRLPARLRVGGHWIAFGPLLCGKCGQGTERMKLHGFVERPERNYVVVRLGATCASCGEWLYSITHFRDAGQGIEFAREGQSLEAWRPWAPPPATTAYTRPFAKRVARLPCTWADVGCWVFASLMLYLMPSMRDPAGIALTLACSCWTLRGPLMELEIRRR